MSRGNNVSWFSRDFEGFGKRFKKAIASPNSKMDKRKDKDSADPEDIRSTDDLTLDDIQEASGGKVNYTGVKSLDPNELIKVTESVDSQPPIPDTAKSVVAERSKSWVRETEEAEPFIRGGRRRQSTLLDRGYRMSGTPQANITVVTDPKEEGILEQVNLDDDQSGSDMDDPDETHYSPSTGEDSPQEEITLELTDTDFRPQEPAQSDEKSGGTTTESNTQEDPISIKEILRASQDQQLLSQDLISTSRTNKLPTIPESTPMLTMTTFDFNRLIKSIDSLTVANQKVHEDNIKLRAESSLTSQSLTKISRSLDELNKTLVPVVRYIQETDTIVKTTGTLMTKLSSDVGSLESQVRNLQGMLAAHVVNAPAPIYTPITQVKVPVDEAPTPPPSTAELDEAEPILAILSKMDVEFLQIDETGVKKIRSYYQKCNRMGVKYASEDLMISLICLKNKEDLKEALFKYNSDVAEKLAGEIQALIQLLKATKLDTAWMSRFDNLLGELGVPRKNQEVSTSMLEKRNNPATGDKAEKRGPTLSATVLTNENPEVLVPSAASKAMKNQPATMTVSELVSKLASGQATTRTPGAFFQSISAPSAPRDPGASRYIPSRPANLSEDIRNKLVGKK